MKGSLIILSFFATGLLLGLYRLFPVAWLQYEYSFYVLAALMFSVGFSLGHQPDTIKQFRRIHSRVLFLPLMTILGTWFGVIIISFFSKYTISDYLAVGSGFGYYSLSSILITEYKGIELGTIALLANIFREIITLLFAPLMVKYFGKLSPIAAGGATTMDTTFPIIIRSSGKEYSIVSIYHGFVMDISVPFLVTLFCSLK
ncbi:MAG: lysine exporter LysO family protein [Paludibacter sp.]|nr:lysine exporter LysO family protein [Paludibacter sp.]